MPGDGTDLIELPWGGGEDARQKLPPCWRVIAQSDIVSVFYDEEGRLLY